MKKINIILGLFLLSSLLIMGCSSNTSKDNIQNDNNIETNSNDNQENINLNENINAESMSSPNQEDKMPIPKEDNQVPGFENDGEKPQMPEMNLTIFEGMTTNEILSSTDFEVKDKMMYCSQNVEECMDYCKSYSDDEFCVDMAEFEARMPPENMEIK